MEDAFLDCQKSYATLLRAHGGDENRVFTALVTPILQRVARQLGVAPLDEAGCLTLVGGLWRALGEAGWTPTGATGEMATTLETIVARAMTGVPALGAGSVWENAVRQIVKALTYPELTECRLSYAEVDAKGVCRRQTMELARARVSGAHCVDCPYWTALGAEGHRAALAARWRPGSGACLAGAESVFLPEDFRQLRLWLWGARRDRGPSGIV